jgi:hypothetical protein
MLKYNILPSTCFGRKTIFGGNIYTSEINVTAIETVLRQTETAEPCLYLLLFAWYLFVLKLVVCILLRVLGQVQGFRLTQHWFEYFIQ